MPRSRGDTRNGKRPGRQRGSGAASAPTVPYQAFLEGAIGDAAHRAAVARVLRDPEHPHFARLTQWADAVVNGLPVRRVEVKDVTPQRQLTGDEAAQRVVGMLPNLVALSSPELQQGLLAALHLALGELPRARRQEIEVLPGIGGYVEPTQG